MNFTLTNEFEELLELTNVKVIYGFIFSFAELIGLICYSGIVYFEYYGGDPMKRSLKNKLIAQICISIILLSIYYSPAFAWRVIIGPLNEKFAVFSVFSRNLGGTFNILCFTEIIIHKVLLTFGFKHFCSIDEEFIFMVLNSFNYFFAFSTQISRWHLATFENLPIFELLSNTKTTIEIVNYFWPIFMLIIFTINISGFLALLIKKYRDYKSNQIMVQNQIIFVVRLQDGSTKIDLNINNQTHNEPIFYSYEIFILTPITLILITLYMVPIYFDLNKEYATEYSLLIFEFFGLCFYGIILPLYIMGRKKDIRTFLWTEFKKFIL